MRYLSLILCMTLFLPILLIGCSERTPSPLTTVTLASFGISTADQTAAFPVTPSESATLPTSEPSVTTASVTLTPSPDTTSVTSTVTATDPMTTTLPSVITTAPITTTPQSVTTTAPITTTPPTVTTTTPPVTQTTPDPPAPIHPTLTGDSVIVYTAVECPVYADSSLEQEMNLLSAGTSVLCISVGDTVSVLSYDGKNCYVRTSDLTEDVPEEAIRLMDQYGGIYYPGEGKLIAIDAGHQDHAMTEKEPLGPGSTEMKAKLSSGTQGVVTRIPEYELNLAVALKLRDELISRGYGVVMIRESNQVNISNAERALIANAYGADAFVRIHANGSTDSAETGAFAICQTKNNPYNGDLYEESLRLTRLICDSFCEATDTPRQSDWQTDTMTGINWAEVPVTILEMGYMSNPDEDRKMATDEFRTAAAIGIADGLDAFFEGE
ncbi:MAG: N-acetylmuramoyl-L-alanine amidase [Eubacteriales bacterium]